MWQNTIISKGVEPVRWLLVAGIAYTMATTIWFFFATPVAPVSQAPAEPRPQAVVRPSANVNWILAKHLFGEAGATPVETTSNETPAVQTRLPLELQSVFVANEPADSAAIVAQRGKSGKLYTVGENLPGNAKLVEVLTDRIILRRAGTRETLLFPKAKTSFQAQPSESGTNRGTPVTRETTSTTRQPAELVDDYRRKFAENANAALDELGIEPVDADAGGGYRIGATAQSSYLRQAGLQPGDVILSVNGQPVGDIQRDQMELTNIMAQGSARIEIQRGARRFFITASLHALDVP